MRFNGSRAVTMRLCEMRAARGDALSQTKKKGDVYGCKRPGIAVKAMMMTTELLPCELMNAAVDEV